MLTPTLRHVASCIRCGWRQPTRLTNSYATHCTNGCGELEHMVVAFDSGELLAQVRRAGQIRRGHERRGWK